MPVNSKQVLEWTENPVTLELKKLAGEELERIVEAPLSDNIVRGNPELTQELLVENVTRELEWGAFISMLDGDWSEMEIEDE